MVGKWVQKSDTALRLHRFFVIRLSNIIAGWSSGKDAGLIIQRSKVQILYPLLRLTSCQPRLF